MSAKYIMRYFATADDADTLGKTKKTDEGMTEVEEQILGSYFPPPTPSKQANLS